MNYKILKLSLAVIGLMLVSNSNVYANLASEFERPITKNSPTNDYDRLNVSDINTDLILKSQFTNAAGFQDPDDGYYELDFDFNYDFAGRPTSKVWVSVNGFITFAQPLNQPQDRPEGLFSDGVIPGTFQQYVIAPFWGDHYYRDINDAGYEPSNVLIESTDDYVTVEWRNLNINDESIPSSIGNFQVTFYKSTTFNVDQGNFEFAYGLVNGGAGAVVITDGASIGAKAEGTDYINGLCWDPTDTGCDPFASRELSNVWQPSGGTNKLIAFDVRPVIRVFDSWGDGDTDLSQGRGQRHENLAQSRFVTFNDVRRILRAVVENEDLDSALGREAFHADVDHDGRYYRVDTTVWRRDNNGAFINENGSLLFLADTDGDFIPDRDDVDPNNNPNGEFRWLFYLNTADFNAGVNPQFPDNIVQLQDSVLRELIPVRSRRYQDDLPPKVSRLNNELYFAADENDAKLITNYLRASVVSLPWIYDTVSNGKLTQQENLANNVKFGEVIEMDGSYRIPVYSNGLSEDGLSNYFEIDAKITDVSVVSNEDPFAIAEYSDNRFVFAGSDNYTSENPFAFITIETTNDVVNVNNVRINDESANDSKIVINNNTSEISYLNAYPTVFSPSNQVSTVTVNVPVEGYYTLNVFDMKGNLVNTIFEGNLDTDSKLFDFDGYSQSSTKLSSGVYIYKLSGNGINSSVKTIVE